MKIAFIDLSYHKKTKSNDFFKDFLESNFEVEYHWIAGWKDRSLNINAINAANYDAIIFFQVILKPGEMKLFDCQNLIWVPMYDSVITKSLFNWFLYKIQGVKLISFSKFLHDKLAPIKFNSLHVKYFPKINSSDNKSERLNIFFWQRSNEVNWGLVKRLIKKEDVEKFILRKAFDRNENFITPSELEMKDYNIKIVEGWLEKEEYMEMLKSCNLFIAPRAAEGIGLSFLEAMSYNMPILAPDAPTMNEYVTHAVNGYLYDIDNPQVIDFSSLKTIRQNLKKDMVQGEINWEDDKKKIIEFIRKENKRKSNFFRSLFFLTTLLKDFLSTKKRVIGKR